MPNKMTLEFGGDAAKLQKASKQATAAVDDVAAAAKNAGEDMSKAAKQSVDYGEKIGNIGAGVTGMTDAVDSAGQAVQALADLQDAARAKAHRLAQAANDVAQAQEDANQAMLDGKQAIVDLGQAEIDKEQADLDAATALKDYNEAVKEHGKGSLEARQASLDLKQAQQDLTQANQDAQQYQADANQAVIDGTQAQLDLSEAQKEANPPDLQKWADQLNMVTPLLTAVVGVVGLITAAQWAWNAAQLASPTTWIILAIVALIAIVVLLVKHWDKVKAAGSAAWRWIKDAAKSAWDWMKQIPGWIGKAFSKIASVISAPYRAAFNLIADAWNNTIGRLSWTVPGWIPFIGGNTISVPHLPKFHSGGIVPGAPGTEVPIMAMAGEAVGWPGRGGDSDMVHVTIRVDSDVLIEATARGVRRRGGNAQRVLGGANA